MKRWRIWIGIAVSAACLYWTARGIDWRRLAEALRQVRFLPLVPAFAVLVLGLVARAYRWRALFFPLTGLKIGRLFNVVSIGSMMNNLSPFRLGDVLKAYLCAELEHLSAAHALSTVAVERIVDTLTVMAVLLFLIPYISLPAALIRPAFVIGVVAVGAVLFLCVVASRKERSLAILRRLSARPRFLDASWLERVVSSAVDGLAALGSWRSAAAVIAWSLVIWLGAALQFHVVTWAVGLSVPFTATLTVLCLTSLGMVVPSSPGYVGVFEYLTVLALSLFGVGKEQALTYALVLHAVGYVGLAVPGVIALWVEGYSWARLRDMIVRTRDGAYSA